MFLCVWPAFSHVSLDLDAHRCALLDVLRDIILSIQVVAGMRYRVKIQVGDEHWHLQIIKPLPHTGDPAFVVEGSIEKGKSAADPFE